MILPVVLLLALQDEPAVEVRVDAWQARLTGSMRFDEKPAVGDRVDLAGDLGADSDWMPALAAAATFGAHRFSLSAARLRWESEEVLDRDRRWNESSFSAGENVESRIDLFEGELAWRHRPGGTFEVSPGAGLRYLRLETVLASASQGRDDDHAIVLAPAVGVDLEWRPDPRLGLGAEVEFTWLDAADWEVRGVEAAFRADWSPSRSFELHAGWRMESLRLTKDTSKERNDFRGEAGGPFVGVEIRL